MTPGKKRILYVDDDADDRELLAKVMQKVAPEVEIIFAENGLLALELLTGIEFVNNPPCLVVLDLNMPFLNGKQTFERIKATGQFENIPVAILSSGERPSDKSFFGKHGVPYFTKPVKLSDIETLADKLFMLCK